MDVVDVAAIDCVEERCFDAAHVGGTLKGALVVVSSSFVAGENYHQQRYGPP